MKISRKDLRNIIYETLLREKGKERKTRNLRQRIANALNPNPAAVQNPVSSDKLSNGDNKAQSKDSLVTNRNAAQPNGSSPKKTAKSNAKVAQIQRIIGVKDDGVWGNQTNDKWKDWITNDETIKKIKNINSPGSLRENKRININFLLEQDSQVSIEKFIKANSGNAAKIAEKLGFAPTLSGVLELVQKIEETETSSNAGENKTSLNAGESNSTINSIESIDADWIEQNKNYVFAIPASSVEGEYKDNFKFDEIKLDNFDIVKNNKSKFGNEDFIFSDYFDFYSKNENNEFYIYADGSGLNNFKLGPYIKKNINSKLYYVLPFYEQFNPKGESPTNESKNTFGKSHATLIRERYRRY